MLVGYDKIQIDVKQVIDRLDRVNLNQLLTDEDRTIAVGF
jgi:hypothetical protein